jgi:hypothetical protein
VFIEAQRVCYTKVERAAARGRCAPFRRKIPNDTSSKRSSVCFFPVERPVSISMQSGDERNVESEAYRVVGEKKEGGSFDESIRSERENGFEVRFAGRASRSFSRSSMVSDSASSTEIIESPDPIKEDEKIAIFMLLHLICEEMGFSIISGGWSCHRIVHVLTFTRSNIS